MFITKPVIITTPNDRSIHLTPGAQKLALELGFGFDKVAVMHARRSQTPSVGAGMVQEYFDEYSSFHGSF